MSKSLLYVCDSCGTPRTPSNHWLMANIKYTRIEVMPWEEGTAATDETILHLCGEGCAAKILSRQVSTWRAA